MASMTDKPTRVLLGVRGMNKEAGVKVDAALQAMQGVSKAIPDDGQIEVHYDPSYHTIMDLVRTVRMQGFLAGML